MNAEYVAPQQLVVPPGVFETPRGDNGHPILHKRILYPDGRLSAYPVELVHQVRHGDCGLASFLNTVSLEEGGRLPMDIVDARINAILARERRGVDASDITQNDMPLSYGDIITLYTEYWGFTPEQQDIVTIDGRRSPADVSIAILDEVLEKLDTYPSGLCSVGVGYHSTTIKKVAGYGDCYMHIDPMNPEGVAFMNTAQLMTYLQQYMQGRPADNNFFFFINK